MKHQNFLKTFEDEVKQFLLIVREMYKALPDSMELLFENPPVFPQGTIPDPERIGQVKSEILLII